MHFTSSHYGVINHVWNGPPEGCLVFGHHWWRVDQGKAKLGFFLKLDSVNINQPAVWNQMLQRPHLCKLNNCFSHDYIIKQKHLLRYWTFVWGTQRSPVNSLHKGQWRRALVFSLICTWTNDWVNNKDSSDLRHHHAHHNTTAMFLHDCQWKRGN